MSYRTPDHPLAGLCQTRRSRAASRDRPSYAGDDTGSDLAHAAIAARAADHVLGCHARHHQGKTLARGDTRLLGELLQLLESHRRVLVAHSHTALTEPLRRRIVELDEQLILLDHRREEIVLATRESDSPGTLADLTALRLADQLRWYDEHIAGRPRLSRRPRLLHRIILSLEDLQAQFSNPSDSPEATYPATRRAIVDRLSLLRLELGAIELTHQAASDEDRIASLRAAAHDAQMDYDLHFAQRDRLTRDLDRLGHLCDRLFEIEIQATALMEPGAPSLQTHLLELIAVVQDELDLCEDEYACIQTLQSASRLQEN